MSEVTELTHHGLRVTAVLQPSPGPRFPDGAWHGCVEGRACTGPLHDPTSAMAAARANIADGGFVVAILTAIETMEGLIASGKATQRTFERLAIERATLRKVLPLVHALEKQAFAARAKAHACPPLDDEVYL